MGRAGQRSQLRVPIHMTHVKINFGYAAGPPPLPYPCSHISCVGLTNISIHTGHKYGGFALAYTVSTGYSYGFGQPYSCGLYLRPQGPSHPHSPVHAPGPAPLWLRCLPSVELLAVCAAGPWKPGDPPGLLARPHLYLHSSSHHGIAVRHLRENSEQNRSEKSRTDSQVKGGGNCLLRSNEHRDGPLGCCLQ